MTIAGDYYYSPISVFEYFDPKSKTVKLKPNPDAGSNIEKSSMSCPCPWGRASWVGMEYFLSQSLSVMPHGS